MEDKLSKIPLSELLKMNPENPSLCENEYGKRQTVLELSQNINLNKLERWFLVQKKNIIPGFLYSKKEYYSLFEDKNEAEKQWNQLNRRCCGAIVTYFINESEYEDEIIKSIEDLMNTDIYERCQSLIRNNFNNIYEYERYAEIDIRK